MVNLPEKEMKNVYLAVAAGCIRTLERNDPSKKLSRVRRELDQLYALLIKDIAPLLPQIASYNMKLFKDTIVCSEKVLQEITQDNTKEQRHILLNLAGFCLDALPLRDKHWTRYNKLFDLFPEAHQYKDVRSGDRIFTRINTELQILVAQRGGDIV